ncbi:MAG: efflux RND transporter periplasmic adaptor subunit [Burkholderiales bacterium]
MQVTRNFIGMLTWSLLGVALTLTGCSKQQATAPQNGDIPVGVVVVKAQKIFITVELPGRTSPYQIAEVRPQVGGIVMKRIFREGADVKAGETLYQIDPAVYKAAYDSAQANLAKAEANLTTIKLKAERYRELVKINAVSKQDFDDVDAALKQAIADVAANKAAVDAAGINLGYTRITSPITGRIGISTVTPGALLVPSQAVALTTVQQLDPIYVDVTQSSDELMRMKHALETGLLKRIGADAARVSLMMDDKTTYALEGKLKLSDVTVNQGTSTVTLRAVFPNPKHDLLPGMFVHAVLEEGVDEEGIVVPQQGVTHNARGVATALVLGTDGKVEQRVLELGEAIGDKWLVKSGLKAGDQLIVDGLQKVKPGTVARAVPIEDAAATSPARQ